VLLRVKTSSTTNCSPPVLTDLKSDRSKIPRRLALAVRSGRSYRRTVAETLAVIASLMPSEKLWLPKFCDVETVKVRYPFT